MEGLRHFDKVRNCSIYKIQFPQKNRCLIFQFKFRCCKKYDFPWFSHIQDRFLDFSSSVRRKGGPPFFSEVYRANRVPISFPSSFIVLLSALVRKVPSLQQFAVVPFATSQKKSNFNILKFFQFYGKLEVQHIFVLGIRLFFSCRTATASCPPPSFATC